MPIDEQQMQRLHLDKDVLWGLQSIAGKHRMKPKAYMEKVLTDHFKNSKDGDSN